MIYHDVQVGSDCVIHSQAVLGADGFGFAQGPGGWEKIVQSGGVRMGDRVEIGACTTVDRGALEHTVIEDGVIIDNQVQIAHNCRIGKNTAIAGCAGLAGSTIIGANCTLAGGVGVVGHVEICDNVHVTGMTMVTRSITEPGSYSSGTPMAAPENGSAMPCVSPSWMPFSATGQPGKAALTQAIKEYCPMMDIAEIRNYLPHRYPFLLVDRVVELTPGESIVAYKNLSINEPFL